MASSEKNRKKTLDLQEPLWYIMYTSARVLFFALKTARIHGMQREANIKWRCRYES